MAAGVPRRSPEELLQIDIEALREGIRLLLVNEFQRSEEVFRQGAQRPRPKLVVPGVPVDPSGPELCLRDTRGAFTLVWTLVNLMFGLLSFASDQLDECLGRVWDAERLLLEDPPWVGQRMLLGMVYLIAGVVHGAKNAWLKAGVNLVRALRFLREFEHGLSYEGPEEPLVRSTSLFFLGLFNLVMSMLPPQVLRLASKAGGRSLKGNRAEALRLLADCHAQEGVMAPFSVLVLLLHRVWIKTYVGEGVGEEDLRGSQQLLDWTAIHFPGSAVFGFWQTELHAARREVREASQCVERVAEVLAHLKLPAVDSFLDQKRACLSVALLDWGSAAMGFGQSLSVSVSRGRRSYVPFLSYLAGLCYLLDDKAAECSANFSRVAEYTRLRKRNWPPEDDLAFQKVKDYGSPPSVGKFRALLDVAEAAMLKLHVLHTMPPDSAHLLRELLVRGLPSTCRFGDSSNVASPPPPEEVARALLLLAELARLGGNSKEAEELALEGLSFAPKLGSRGIRNGTVALLHLTLALLGVDGHAEALQRCSAPCRAYDEAMKFKQLGLTQNRVAEASGTAGASGATETHDNAEAEVEAEVEAVGQGTALAPQAGVSAEAEEEEFFSAAEEEGDDGHPGAPARASTAALPLPAGAPRSGGHSPPGAAAATALLTKTLGRASGRAAKAWRGLSKRPSAAAAGYTASVGGAGAGIAAVAAAAGATSAVGAHRTSVAAAEAQSRRLYLEALRQQADQGDCSIVAMPPPGAGAPESEVQAYLRWAHWSSLRGLPRREALRRHAAAQAALRPALGSVAPPQLSLGAAECASTQVPLGPMDIGGSVDFRADARGQTIAAG